MFFCANPFSESKPTLSSAYSRQKNSKWVFSNKLTHWQSRDTVWYYNYWICLYRAGDGFCQQDQHSLGEPEHSRAPRDAARGHHWGQIRGLRPGRKHGLLVGCPPRWLHLPGHALCRGSVSCQFIYGMYCKTCVKYI